MLKRAVRRARYGTPVIVVSGLPRSGTSMMMKMLDAGGVELVTDQIRTADEDNPKGYFELEQVKELDKSADKSWVADCRGKAVKVISSLLEELPEGHAYKIIFMRRHLNEVIASQNKMLQRRGEERGAEDEKMIRNYTMHLRKVDYLLRNTPNFERFDVDYKDAIENPQGHAERIAGFLEMPLDIERMTGVVDASLYRNRQ